VIVPDAAILVAWAVPGADRPLAERIRVRDPRWTVPAVWRLGFRDHVAGLVRGGTLTLERAQALETAAAGAVHEVDGYTYRKLALRLTVESGCAAARCEMAALATFLDVPLVTTDAELLAAFPRLAVHPEDFVARMFV
jgi:predicted nucleic acid-binding protein